MQKRTARITGVGHYLPEDKITNQDLEKLVETNDEWITSRTGIKERRILRDPSLATAHMSAEAAKEALAMAGVHASEVDAIIVGTVTPDYMFPATACLVQEMIGADKAWGYDLSAACSGFLFGLTTGAMYIESGRYEKVLVIGADKMTSILDYSDRTSCIIFGDGGGAVLLEAGNDGTGVLDFVNRCQGDMANSLSMLGGGSRNPSNHETVEKKWHYLRQDGKAVFKKATEGMAEVSAEIMRRNQLTADDVSWLVPHQANLRIIDATARRMELPMEKVMVNIEKYGNTTAGTIPLCLYDWRHQLKKGDNIVIAAFGGGFTWGAAYVKWSVDL